MSDPVPTPNRTKLTVALQKDYGRLVGFVKKRLTATVQGHDAEDVLSDVVITMLERADLLTEIENVTAYLFTALANRITDLLRRKRELPLPDDELDMVEPIAPEDTERRMILDQALNALSLAERTVWLAIELDGYSFQELAELWDEPIGTLLSRKSRATKSLRRMLGEDKQALLMTAWSNVTNHKA